MSPATVSTRTLLDNRFAIRELQWQKRYTKLTDYHDFTTTLLYFFPAHIIRMDSEP